jgi:hypothetical protein
MFTKVTVTDAGVAPCPPLIGLKTIVPVPLHGATTEAGTGLVVYVVNLATGSVTADERRPRTGRERLSRIAEPR